MLDACIVYLNYRLKKGKQITLCFQALQSLKSQLELTT